jgi:trehalose 6-phosphate phosphatase
VPDDDWALFLDVDGCLLDFADAPGDVVVPPGLRECLSALSRRLDGALALVSGRSLQVVDDLFWPLRLPTAGMHGLERRSRDGSLPAPRTSPALRQALAKARILARGHPRAIVEDKGASFALHWRAAPEAGTEMRAFAEDAVAKLPGYRLQHGDLVVELLPAGGDKGRAVADFMQEAPFAGRLPAYAGDDLTDEAAFDAVNARGGLSVLVGDRESSEARFGLRDPTDVRAWLGMAETAAEPWRT